MALVALIQLSALQLAIGGVATIRTNETVGPAHLKQRLATLHLGPIGLKKFRET